MNEIAVATVDALDVRDAVAIVRRLTKPGSEFQQEVGATLDGTGSSSTPIVIWRHDGCLAGWTCSHIWRDQQTLEMFVDPRYRQHGKAFAMVAILKACGTVNIEEPVAVFSPTTARIARAIGFATVREYKHDGDDWVRV